MALLCLPRRFSCILWAFLYSAPGFEILALYFVSRSSSPGLPCLLHLGLFKLTGVDVRQASYYGSRAFA